MKKLIPIIKQSPLSVLIYSALLLIIALISSLSTLFSGTWDAATVDLVMAFLLLLGFLKNVNTLENRSSNLWEKLCAWGILIAANLLIFLPGNDFSGNILRAFSFVLLLVGGVMYWNNWRTLFYAFPVTLWACVFIPFHEELMLMASYPLRLSATMLSALLLKFCGTDVVYSGSSLHLPDLDIAITDACSGIYQLDAFLLIGYITVKIMQKKELLQLLHFAFIVPSIIIGNTLRIVLTVLLYQFCGSVILGKFWHITLGYVQIILALVIFLMIGKLFCSKPEKTEVEKV